MKIDLQLSFNSYLRVFVIFQNTYCPLLGSAYELDLATRPIEVVLILCSPVSFKLINKSFIFVFTLRWIRKYIYLSTEKKNISLESFMIL